TRWTPLTEQKRPLYVSNAVLEAKECRKIAERLDRPSERKELAGLQAHFAETLYSSAGGLLSRDVELGQSFDFREVTEEGRVAYFLMNSLKLKESAKVLGKFVLQDLMRAAGERYSSRRRGDAMQQRPITVIIDEFGAFAVPEFTEFMDRARGANISIVIAHQSRSDLSAVSPDFQKRIEANANTKIIGSIEDPDDREYYSRILGAKDTSVTTVQMDSGWLGDSPTGLKSVHQGKEFIIHPDRLSLLSQGQVFTVSRTVDQKYGFVAVPRAIEVEEGSSDMTPWLAEVRDRYTRGEAKQYLKLPTDTDAKEAASMRVHLTDGEEKRQAPELWN
ncbi:TraM recognition domain-containing protein, partial [Bdellovibrionota bacterium FG-2]